MLQSFVTCLGSFSDSILGSILGSILEQNRSQIDPQIESKMGRPAPFLEFLFDKLINPNTIFVFLGGPFCVGLCFQQVRFSSEI